MKKVLQLTCVHGGAGTAAALLQNEDGIARGGAATWTAPRGMAITKVSTMTPNSVGITIVRGGHTADNVTLPCLGDNLADKHKTHNLQDYLDGGGIVVLANEVLNFLSIAAGACTSEILIELDDACPRVNVRCPRVAGAAAAVADTPTETLANVRAALSSTGRYKLKAMYITSTTIQHLTLRWTKQGENTVQYIDGANALAGGNSTLQKLGTPLTGTGADFGTDLAGDIIATAADAAAVQDIYPLFETN